MAQGDHQQGEDRGIFIVILAGLEIRFLVDIFFLGNPRGGPGKNRKVGITGSPGLIDTLKIISGENQIKDKKDSTYFTKIFADFTPLGYF